jgi:N-acetylglucosaminyldiphosphoundecaprenol N-acetyl-beta-D-mannosaminyltransferase
MNDAAPPVAVGAVSVMAVTESGVADLVSDGWSSGRGGSIVTVNVDILRAVSRRPELAALVDDAEIVVADGMPLVWAAALAGTPVPERVTGASLVGVLSAAAGRLGRSVYVIGGEPGVPEAAASALARQNPGLVVAGTESPPFGFDRDETRVADLVARVAAAQPDLVLVGLGFPRQEQVIARLRSAAPRAWMLGCGAGIPFAAGQFARAPRLLQRLGGEWLHRLSLEPRRLARRYLVDDAPFALGLLARALGTRIRRTVGRASAPNPAVLRRAEPADAAVVPLRPARPRPAADGAPLRRAQ